MYLLHPTGLLKLSFGSNCNLRQHLMQHQKIYFYIFIVLFTPNSMLQSSKKLSPSLRQSLIYLDQIKGEGGLQKRYIRFSHDCGFKKQKHLFTRFQGCGFQFLLILLILNLLILKLK